jgi:hypothetical protein
MSLVTYFRFGRVYTAANAASVSTNTRARLNFSGGGKLYHPDKAMTLKFYIIGWFKTSISHVVS